MRTASLHGLSPVEPAVDLKQVMAHVRAVVADVYQHESPESLRSDGIDVFLGGARFLDPHTLAVGETTLTARRILIATGARPYIPPVEGLDKVDYLTYENARHLIVVGGGPIGCEMAQAFRRLGAGVTIVEGMERLLLNDEPDAAHVLEDRFAREGIDLRFNAMIERAWQDRTGIHVVASGDELLGDALLVAVGRRPYVDGLGLEEAGITFSEHGIPVDDHLRTGQRHIYAAGDSLGGYQFTHYAGWQAFMAVRNALLPGATKGIADQVSWTTFTDPELAHVGLTEIQARDRFGDSVMTCEWPMEHVDRARAEGDTTGFIKLIHRQDGTLLGVTIVAGRAGEMINEWTIALDRANSIHVYPTYSMANMQAAAYIRVAQLLSGTSGRVVRGLARLMR